MNNLDENINIALTISNMSQIINVHQRTLRIYDKEGVLVPKRTYKNRRYYTLSDIQKGKFIQFFTRNLSLNITAVKIILALLEKNNIEPKNYTSCINEITKNWNIDENIQKENIIKNSRRGRKKKNIESKTQ